MSDLSNLMLAIPALTLTGVFAFVAVARQFLYICEPNEALVFSGRKHVTADGRTAGFRVITGGRALRIPILERVERMDLSLLSVPMQIRGAYSQGGIPLSLHAIANVKVSANDAVIGNAIERFLGRGRDEIARVAKETLEGHLRGVLATMTPEEVNEDRLKFTEKLAEEAGLDLRKLGLELDTLKIQAVSDDRNYLESLGRTRIAEIVRTAEVAESDALRAAEEAESMARARGGIAETNARANVQRKVNELRQIQAELGAAAASEEERAVQGALTARAEAEADLQGIRAQLEELRLQADVVIPAEVERRVSELLAAGHAAVVAERGKAVAASITEIGAAWAECGEDAMDIMTLPQTDAIFREVTAAASALQAKQVSLLDPGDGSAIANYVSSYPATVNALLEKIEQTFGIHLRRALSGEPGEIAATPTRKKAA